MTVYDTLGNDHAMTLYFVKTATVSPATWNVHATLDGANPVAMANLTFNRTVS